MSTRSTQGPSVFEALAHAADPEERSPSSVTLSSEPSIPPHRGEAPMYSVVVPVMNEQDNVRPLVQRVTAVLEAVGQPFEIVFVDDGSRDATPVILRAMAAEDARVRAVRFSRNFGQEAAVQAGYKAARGEWILQMDGDLQNPPEDIPKLLAMQGEGYDIVYGLRTGRKDPIFRKAASQTMRWVMRRMLDIELPDDISTFRLMRASTAKLLADLPERQKFLSALACWVGARYTTVNVGHAARAAGTTKYNFTKLLNNTFDLVVGFSSKPLRYVGYVGLLFAAIGFALAARAIFYQLFLGTSMTGWASLFSIVSVLGGVQLVALSLIGEYIARIYFQAQARPFFFVAEFIEQGQSALRRNPIASHPPVDSPPLEVLASIRLVEEDIARHKGLSLAMPGLGSLASMSVGPRSGAVSVSVQAARSSPSAGVASVHEDGSVDVGDRTMPSGGSIAPTLARATGGPLAPGAAPASNFGGELSLAVDPSSSFAVDPSSSFAVDPSSSFAVEPLSSVDAPPPPLGVGGSSSFGVGSSSGGSGDSLASAGDAPSTIDISRRDLLPQKSVTTGGAPDVIDAVKGSIV